MRTQEPQSGLYVPYIVMVACAGEPNSGDVVRVVAGGWNVSEVGDGEDEKQRM